jgi:hypothetical protein
VAATAVSEIRNITLVSDTDVTNGYQQALGSSPSASPAAEMLASAIGANAVAQYQAAVVLQDAVHAVWEALRIERGGEL